MSRPGHLWLFFPTATLGALWLSWRCLAAVDFLYPVFYDALDIHQHIQTFAPQNPYKKQFENTSIEERFRLFAAIVDAIHASGEGLVDLAYHDCSGRYIDHLLRPPEVGHLQDVANLVDRSLPVGALAMGWALIHLALVKRRRWVMPPPLRLLGASLLGLGSVIAVFLLAGPKRLYDGLHEWVFPPNYPWFFYYQDSLMSTLMKAPDLFGAIAVIMLGLALLFFTVLIWVAYRFAFKRG